MPGGSLVVEPVCGLCAAQPLGGALLGPQSGVGCWCLASGRAVRFREAPASRAAGSQEVESPWRGPGWGCRRLWPLWSLWARIRPEGLAVCRRPSELPANGAGPPRAAPWGPDKAGIVPWLPFVSLAAQAWPARHSPSQWPGWQSLGLCRRSPGPAEPLAEERPPLRPELWVRVPHWGCDTCPGVPELRRLLWPLVCLHGSGAHYSGDPESSCNGKGP